MVSKSDGLFIAVEFSQPLIGDVSGNESFFSVSVPMYNYVPEGVLTATTVPVISTSRYQDTNDVLLLEFSVGNTSSFQNAAGAITVNYAGGTLQGSGGPVEQFSYTFTPTELAYKGHQNDAEHISLVNALAIGTATQVLYSELSSSNEHLEIKNVSAIGTITNVIDI